MATMDHSSPREQGRIDAVTAAIGLVGVTQLATGLFALLAPGAFYDALAGYPPQNDHFVMDVGSWQIALGAIALYGARRPGWRTPLLGFLALQYWLHFVPHVLDVGDSDPSWQGPFAVVALGLAALLLTGLFVRERSR